MLVSDIEGESSYMRLFTVSETGGLIRFVKLIVV